MTIETLEIVGFRPAFEALRLPFSKECRSETHFIMYNDEYKFTCTEDVNIDPRDLDLMSTLVKRGDEHAKPMRGIIVWTSIEAPIHWWCELETYRAGHERLFSESTMHTEGRSLSGDALAEELHKIPFDRVLKKIDFFSYQALRNMYFQRKNHRKKEWREFCTWVEGLPFSDKLITIE